MKLGFIGLGLMGLPMARNLLQAGHELIVHNRSQAGVEELVAAGATRATTVAGVAAADFIMTALPVPETVADIYFGDGGLIANARPGSVLIDFSTNGTDTALRCGIHTVTVVNNNRSLNQEQELNEDIYGSRTEGSDELWMLSDGDFAALAESMGCFGVQVRRAAELEGALEQAFASGRPAVVDVKTHIEGIAPPAWTPG